MKTFLRQFAPLPDEGDVQAFLCGFAERVLASFKLVDKQWSVAFFEEFSRD